MNRGSSKVADGAASSKEFAVGGASDAGQAINIKTPIAGSRRRVLVIDDEAILCRTFLRLLRRKYEVEAVMCPEYALKLLQTREFDVVVCDVNMPGMTGLELRDKAVELRPELLEKFLFCSGGGLSQAANRRLARERVLYKPFNREELFTLVEQLTKRASFGEAR